MDGDTRINYQAIRDGTLQEKSNFYPEKVSQMLTEWHRKLLTLLGSDVLGDFHFEAVCFAPTCLNPTRLQPLELGMHSNNATCLHSCIPT